jgi:hypothetical protein
MKKTRSIKSRDTVLLMYRPSKNPSGDPVPFKVSWSFYFCLCVLYSSIHWLAVQMKAFMGKLCETHFAKIIVLQVTFFAQPLKVFLLWKRLVGGGGGAVNFIMQTSKKLPIFVPYSTVIAITDCAVCALIYIGLLILVHKKTNRWSLPK